MIVKLIGRLIWIVIAYLISAFSAGLAFVLSIAGVPGALVLDFGELSATAFLVSSVISVLAFVPAVIAILIAEIFRFRSWIYYVCWGGLAALFSIGGSDLFDRTIDEWSYETDRFAVFFFVPGLVAGLVYWVIAGRSAGQAYRAIPDSLDEN